MISTLSKKHRFDSVFDGQKVFRWILEAMANPARRIHINNCAEKLSGGDSGFLAVALTLLDHEVSFHACENSALSEAIVSLTSARKKSIEAADFVFVTEPRALERILPGVKCGTLADPHKSATVVIQNSGAPACRMRLSGPGIDGYADVLATQTVKTALALRDAQNYEYPQGIDLIFISDGGEIMAIPRLTRMEAE